MCALVVEVAPELMSQDFAEAAAPGDGQAERPLNPRLEDVRAAGACRKMSMHRARVQEHEHAEGARAHDTSASPASTWQLISAPICARTGAARTCA